MYPAFWRLQATTAGDWQRGTPPHTLLAPASSSTGDICVPESAEAQAEIIDAAARLFGNALAFGHSVGLKSAVGTQVPLAKPAGLSSEEAFRGLFTRVEKLIKPR
jgi:hypothetical protein